MPTLAAYGSATCVSIAFNSPATLFVTRDEDSPDTIARPFGREALLVQLDSAIREGKPNITLFVLLSRKFL